MRIRCLIPVFLLQAGALAAVSIDFEEDKLEGVTKSHATLTLTKQAFRGRQALEVVQKAPEKYVYESHTVWNSAPFPLKPGRYALRAAIRLPKGYGMKLELNVFDRDDRPLYCGAVCYIGSPPKNPDEWQVFEVPFNAWSPDCATGKLSLRLPQWLDQHLMLDAIEVVSLPLTNDRRTPAVYPVRVEEKKAPMTTADVPGPDGLVYPDFRYAGTRPGKNILDAPAPHSVNLRDFGGVPGGNIDAALRKALTALPKGGGVIRFEAGEYTMKRFLTLSRDRVALVGAGSGATRIICAYDTPPDGIDFYALPDGGRMSPKQPILIVARPRQEGEPVQSIRLELDGRRIAGFTRSLHSGNHSQLTAKLPADCAPGEHRLRAVVTWFGRPPISREIKITVDPERAVTLPQKGYSAIITLRGKGVEGSPILLAKDAKRGDKVLELASEAVDLKTGDLILLQAEESDRFRAEIGNSCRWGVSRRVLLTVAGREGKRLLLDQPVRVDYPVADAAAIRRCSAVRGVGIQGITFEMKHDFWYHTILLESALDCIIRDVKVLKTGRNPVWTVLAKFCTVSDCSFTDSWYKGGGNSAYVGFGQSYDCLMERVETSKMRHAPVLQWSASGNVIRESTFLHSDAQWHAGWPHENLFENCRILSDTKEFGGYGHAFFASGPADSSHGPSGPRNVVYHCDAESMESSVKLNGNNENWFFVYNRLIARNGDGFHLRDAAPDTLLVNNQVILKTPGRALLLQAGVDSPGLTLTGNRFSGEKAMTVRGLTAPEIDRDNRQDSTALPEPPVPSLYLYQKITPR